MASNSIINHFKPEFLNRVDDIIIFNSLDKEHIKEIVEIQIKGLQQILLEKNIHLDLSESAKNLLAETGFEPSYGARPLKRAIQKYIFDPLSKEILNENVKQGDSIIAEADENKIIFNKK